MTTIILTLLLLHNVNGNEVTINPSHINSMTAAKVDEPNKMYTEAVRCVLNMTDGGHITVVETCDEVRGLLQQLERQK